MNGVIPIWGDVVGPDEQEPVSCTVEETSCAELLGHTQIEFPGQEESYQWVDVDIADDDPPDAWHPPVATAYDFCVGDLQRRLNARIVSRTDGLTRRPNEHHKAKCPRERPAPRAGTAKRCDQRDQRRAAADR